MRTRNRAFELPRRVMLPTVFGNKPSIAIDHAPKPDSEKSAPGTLTPPEIIVCREPSALSAPRMVVGASA